MRKYVWLLFVALSFQGLSAQRFVYVDMEYMFSQIPEVQRAQEELDANAMEWRTTIQNMMLSVDSAYKAFQAEQVLMTERMKAEKIQEIEDMERAIKVYQQEKFGPEGALFTQKDALLRPIQDKIYDEIQRYAEEKSYDFVLDRSASTMMLFGSDRYNKSDDILKRLGYTVTK
jgi:outer membrane protein